MIGAVVALAVLVVMIAGFEMRMERKDKAIAQGRRKQLKSGGAFWRAKPKAGRGLTRR